MRLSPSRLIWPVLLLLGVGLGPLLFTLWQGYITAPLEISAVQAIDPANKLQTALILITANIVAALAFSAVMGIPFGYLAMSRPTLLGFLVGFAVSAGVIAITHEALSNLQGVIATVALSEHTALILGCAAFARVGYQVRKSREA